jgi:hypothetical protein
VVLRAYREFVREPEWRRTATWLERLTREQLATECRPLEGERERSIHTEEGIPATPPTEEASTLGEAAYLAAEPYKVGVKRELSTRKLVCHVEALG